MLIPSKFNGYVNNVRLYHAGGGVPEAMLISAAVGGGTAAVTGGDPLKGALLGALSGGVGAGIGGAFAGAAPAAIPAATTVAAPAANAGITGLSEAAAIAANPSLYPPGFDIPGMATSFGPSGTASLVSASGSNIMPGLASSEIPKTSFQTAMSDPFAYIKKNQMQSAMAGLAGATGAQKNNTPDEEKYTGPLSRFKFNPETYRPAFYAEGGIASLPFDGYDQQVGEDPYLMASGGISSLGSYSDGGRMLKGPGDGMSDSIPASIANKRPARLADGEFVVPSDVVSHLGNGSTDAGAKQLYAMMNKVRTARTGRKAQSREINPRQYVPA